MNELPISTPSSAVHSRFAIQFLYINPFPNQVTSSFMRPKDLELDDFIAIEGAPLNASFFLLVFFFPARRHTLRTYVYKCSASLLCWSASCGEVQLWTLCPPTSLLKPFLGLIEGGTGTKMGTWKGGISLKVQSPELILNDRGVVHVTERINNRRERGRDRKRKRRQRKERQTVRTMPQYITGGGGHHSCVGMMASQRSLILQSLQYG
jgi:hypothetical protein